MQNRYGDQKPNQNQMPGQHWHIFSPTFKSSSTNSCQPVRPEILDANYQKSDVTLSFILDVFKPRKKEYMSAGDVKAGQGL